ncbi:MAG: hypothetical protein GX422_17495 [Deltaproteobacteria bacterium]|nr:hypothetical protein [Deltaproteobacteria bacterium]
MLRTKRDTVLSDFRHLFSVGIQPALFPLFSMTWATRLYRQRGGKCLILFLHPPKLRPGATPGFRSKKAV